MTSVLNYGFMALRRRVTMQNYVIFGILLALGTALPLAWKWQLGIFRTALFVLAVSVLVAVGLTAVDRLLHFTTGAGVAAMWVVTVLAALAGLLALFFRDPDRSVPAREDVIVSPADGRVIYVRLVRPGRLPMAEKKGRAGWLRELAGTTIGDEGAVAIGISMNMSDVHINRAPVAGRVCLIERVPGTFGSLRDAEMLLSNERVTTVIQGEDLQVAVVQIASRLVRRIVTFVTRGDTVQLGQRVGAIRFGSQVDLLLPDRRDVKIAVQAGDRVVAGQTVAAITVSGRRDATASAHHTERLVDGA